MEIKPQELIEIKSQVSVVQQSAMALTVDSPDSMSKASDALYNVRQAEKYIEEKKTNITRPLMSSLSQIRDLFKPLELNLSDANKTIKAKMLAYTIEEEARIEKEQARIAARVQKGTIKASTAVSKLEDLGEANAGSEGESGKSSIRDVKKIRIIDQTLIPNEYLQPNLPLITEAIIRKGLTILGCEIYVEKIIVSRSKNDHPNLQ